MKHSNWVLVIGIVIALLLIGSLSFSTMNSTGQTATNIQENSIIKATQTAQKVAFKPIWQVSKRLIRID